MKRLIALILSIVMVIGLVPMTANAALAINETEKAKVKLVYMLPLESTDEDYDVSGKMQFKVVSGDKITKTDKSSFFVGIVTEDFDHIYEVANYDSEWNEGGWTDATKYGLNSLSFALSYDATKLTYEPNSYSRGAFDPTTGIINFKNRLNYSGSFLYKDPDVGAFESSTVAYTMYNDVLVVPNTSIAGEDKTKGYTERVVLSATNSKDTQYSFPYSGAGSDYIAIVEFAFKGDQTNLAEGTSLIGFSHSMDGESPHMLGFGTENTSDLVTYLDNHTTTAEGPTQDIREVIDFVEEPLYPGDETLTPVTHNVTIEDDGTTKGSVAVKKGDASTGIAVNPTTGTTYALEETATYTVIPTVTDSANDEFAGWKYGDDGLTAKPDYVTENADNTLTIIIPQGTTADSVPKITATFKAKTVTPQPTKYTITKGAVTGASGTYTYTINGGADQSADGEAEKDDTIVVTPSTVTDYYATVSVVNNSDGNSPVSVSNSGNDWTFAMPAGNVTITVNYTLKTDATGTAPTLDNPDTVDLGTSTTVTIIGKDPTGVTPEGSTFTYLWYKGDPNNGGVQVTDGGTEKNLVIDDLTGDNDGEEYYCVITINPPAGNTTHKPGTVTAGPSVLDVNKGTVAAPTVTPVQPTKDTLGKGSLEITGIAGKDVEYSTDSTFATGVTTVTLDAEGEATVSNLEPGTYYVRHKETPTTNASQNASATLNALYTITSSDAPDNGSYKFTVAGDNTEHNYNANVDYIAAGTTVTITVDPDDTYNPVVTVKKGNDDVTVTDKGDGTYEFTMPSGNVNIEVAFSSTPATGGSITNPQDVTVYLIDGTDSATFTVTPTIPDDASVEYQWYKTDDPNNEGTLIDGATGDSYEVTGIDEDFESESYYYCVATFTKEGCTDTVIKSTAAKLTVVPIVYSDITFEAGVNGTYSYTIDGDTTDVTANTSEIDVAEKTSVTITVGDNATVTVVKAADGTTTITTEQSGNDYTFEMPAEDVVVSVSYPEPEAPKYAINAELTTTGGTYTYEIGETTEPTESEAGKTVTIKVTPEDGFVPVVKVTDAADETKEVEVTINEDGDYEFTMPEYDIDVNVTFREKAKSAITSEEADNGTFSYTVDETPNTADDETSYAEGEDATEVLEGATVTITATADSGYKNPTITVVETTPAEGQTARKITVTNGVFTMPEYDVTITVSFTKETGGFITGGGGGGGRPAVYTVTYNPTGNGSLEAGAKATESVNSGAKPKNVPAVTAKDGFKFLGWTQDGQNVVDPTTVTIRKNTTFTALYEVTDEGAAGLIKKEYSKPYAVGYEDGSFRPQNDITRGELAAMIARLINGDELPDGVYFASFPDVEADAWYNKYIGYLEDKNVLNGYDDGTFRPMDSITRDEISAVITRAQKYAMVSYNGEFVDVTEADWAKEYIATLASLNIVTGYEDGSFRPFAPLSRAEAVTIINRVLAPSTAIVTFTPNDIASHWAEDAIILAVNERELIAAINDDAADEAEEATDEADAEATDEADAEATDETEETTEE